MIENIQWLGHASFKLAGTPSIMIDPWRVVKDGTAPDLILVSHEHYDHCSPADLEKLSDASTKIIASPSAAAILGMDNVTVLRPWQTINFGRTSIRAVPAYTYRGNHPATREDVGFVISQNYVDIYYAGDTDFVPELQSLRCDVAILPIANRDGLMSPEAAVQFVKAVRPSIVIPSHYGSATEGGGQVELQLFQRALDGLTTVVRPDAKEVLFAHR